MALKQTKLNQIPQRNKDLAFGYVREEEKQYKLSIHKMIKYLCLIYLNPNKDKFNKNNTFTDIVININEIKFKYPDCSFGTSYLENIVKSGIHIWKYKCLTKKFNGDEMIGIRDNNFKPLPLNRTFIFGGCINKPVGYGFHLRSGKLTNPKTRKGYGPYYGKKCVNGDIIEMTLDFNDLTLSYKINNKNYGKAFDIKPGEYIASLSIYKGACYSLIAYQKIY